MLLKVLCRNQLCQGWGRVDNRSPPRSETIKSFPKSEQEQPTSHGESGMANREITSLISEEHTPFLQSFTYKLTKPKPAASMRTTWRGFYYNVLFFHTMYSYSTETRRRQKKRDLIGYTMLGTVSQILKCL
jgi:hypothetical protein